MTGKNIFYPSFIRTRLCGEMFIGYKVHVRAIQILH
jgi:hypothetical protein